MNTALPEPTQADLDAALDRMIETARRAKDRDDDPEMQRAAADAYRRLVAQRTSSAR